MRSHHSQHSTRHGVTPSADPHRRALPAVLVVGVAGLFASPTVDNIPEAARTERTASSSPAPSTWSTPTAPAAGSDAEREVAAAYEELAEALEANALDALIELTSGPARVFLGEHARHFAAAIGETDLFPNLHWEPGEITFTDAAAVVDGAIVWGGDQASAREATQFEFRHDGERWLLHSFERNGIPIGQWVTPGTDTPVRSGPVAVELVSTFADLTCLPGAESACPDFLRNSISFDLLVENGSDGDLQPGSLTLPDGTESPAWLETPSGGAYPLLDAVVAGFPPTTTVPVIVLFAAADGLAEGGVLHLTLRTADGTDHPADVPVPPYPHDWTVDPAAPAPPESSAVIVAGGTTSEGDDLAVACDAWFRREGITQSFTLAQAFGENPDVRAWYGDEVVPVTQRFADHVPIELAEEAATAVALSEQVAARGTPLPMRPAEWDTIAGYLFDHCDGTALEVPMADYAFGGVPDALRAGLVMFQLSVPADAEWHEMVVLRVDAPISEALANAPGSLPVDPIAGPRLLAEALRHGEPVDTGSGYSIMPVYSLPVAPGGDGIVGGSFEPGDYVLVCAFGEGTTRPDLIVPRLVAAATDPDVHSHADLGMIHTFTVE